MFLAIKEMKFAKLRYSLIIGIMFLISFVVFLLSGLANGLATEFSEVIDRWDAGRVVISEESNGVLAASQLTIDDLSEVKTSEKAPLALYSGSVEIAGGKENLSFFGTQPEAFFLPELTEGKSFNEKNEVIISQALADAGLAIGDTITIGSQGVEVIVTGIFPKTSYVVTPVMYGSIEAVVETKFGSDFLAAQTNYPMNAILTEETDPIIENKAFQSLSTEAFIAQLPGYAEQNLTLNAMIYFLFVIAAAVIGIFMYVITLQKTALFGVMKVQGISTWFIAKSIIAQSFFVGIIGATLAGLVSYGLSFILPSGMPFAVDLGLWTIYGAVLVLVAIIGGLFSTLTVTKVDPIQAIGG